MYWALSPSLDLEMPYFLQGVNWIGWILGVGLLILVMYLVVGKKQ